MSIRVLTAKELQADSIRLVRVNRDPKNMQDVRYYNADGFCSEYAHACGYLDSLSHCGFELTLGLDCLYHVRVYHSRQPRVIWNVYDNRQEAKRAFKAIRKAILAGADIQGLILQFKQDF